MCQLGRDSGIWPVEDGAECSFVACAAQKCVWWEITERVELGDTGHTETRRVGGGGVGCLGAGA